LKKVYSIIRDALESVFSFTILLMIHSLALVTGGSQRLGKAFALTLARMGYSIGLHYHTSELQAQQTKMEIESFGIQVYLLKADLIQPDQIEKMFSDIDFILNEKHLSLKLLVNSASIMPAGAPRDLELKNWNSALELNLRAPFLLAQQVAKRMITRGLIVNISDIGSQKVWSGYPSYTVSKAGLESLTKLLARALAPNIRVNAIAPGLVLPSDVVTPDEWKLLIDKLPLKRAATLEEITSALQFLINNEYITGQTIVVDGGYSLI
jgi:pteridine reductase